MTRDMELIRKILLQIKSRKDLVPREVEIDGVDRVVVARHVEMLHSAGLVEGVIFGSHSEYYTNVSVTDMT